MFDFIVIIAVIIIIVIYVINKNNEQEKQELLRAAESRKKEEEEAHKKEEARNWPKHPFFQTVLIGTRKFIDNTCEKAKSVPIGRDIKSREIGISISTWGVNVNYRFDFAHESDERFLLNTYGYDSITMKQVETFAYALTDELKLIYADNPYIGIRTVRVPTSGSPYNTTASLAVDITPYHPRYKDVEL